MASFGIDGNVLRIDFVSINNTLCKNGYFDFNFSLSSLTPDVFEFEFAPATDLFRFDIDLSNRGK